MPSSSSGDGHPSGPSERTPLLGSPSDLSGRRPEVRDGDLQAAQVAEQVEGGPAQPPSLPKTRSYPNGGVTDNQVSNGKNGRLPKFGKDGKLEGVGNFKFRCILGGVLLGYTVRSESFLPKYQNTELTISRLLCSIRRSWHQVIQSSPLISMRQILLHGSQQHSYLRLLRFNRSWDDFQILLAAVHCILLA